MSKVGVQDGILLVIVIDRLITYLITPINGRKFFGVTVFFHPEVELFHLKL